MMPDQELRRTSAYERQQAALEQANADNAPARSRLRRACERRRDLWLQLADEIDTYLELTATPENTQETLL